MHVLSLRFLRSWYRCPVNLAIQGAQYIFFALLIGESPRPQPTANKASIKDAWHHWVLTVTLQKWLAFPQL